MFVLDVDGEDGEVSLQALKAEHGELPITLCARTGRTGRDGRCKGCHFYFRSPVGAAIRNSAERLGKGLDIRGDGGYVVAPPSLHSSGLYYQWERSDNAIAVAPDWLIKLAGQPASGAKRHDTKAPGRGRNVALTSIAGRFRRVGHVPAEIKAELLLRNHFHINPLPEAEVETIVKSIANYSPGLGRMNSLPLAEFVREAIRRNGSHYSSPSKFKSPLFHFARIIRSRAVFADLDALSVAERIDPTLRDLANGEVDAWRNHFGDLSSDPRAAFCYAWEQIKSPSISNPLEEAYFEAIFFPLAPSKVYSEGYARFVSIAGYRQRFTPDDDIILPVKTLAEMLDCDRTSISYYLKRAKADGLLKETKPHSYTKHKASEYRFLLELWDFTSRQQRHSHQKNRNQLKPGVPDVNVDL